MSVHQLGDPVHVARQAFLGGDPPPPGLVREQILKSWRRSALNGAVPDAALPYYEDLDGGRLCHAALPVMDQFGSQLDGTVTTLVLADSSSRIIRRWIGEPSVGAALDRSDAIPGVSLAEEHCGTNGIGSAIEERRAVRITGAEHWADRFLGFTCVGAPLMHPLTRQLEGVVTLACRHQDTNELMLPLVLSIARAIEVRLWEDGSRHERLLLESFIATSRRSRRPIVVLNERVIMANPAAARMLDRADHALLWQQAAEAVCSGVGGCTELVLASGEVISSTCRAVRDGTRVLGVVIDLTCHSQPTLGSPPGAPTVTDLLPAPSTALDRLVGRSARWKLVVAEARRLQASSVPVLIAGEPGVGKLTLALAMLEGVDTTSTTVFDAALEPAEGLTEWLRALRTRLMDPSGAVVIRHVELLQPAPAQALCAALDATGGGPRVAATMTAGPALQQPGYQPLLQRLSGVRLTVPPLRERPEDITQLAEVLLSRHGGQGRRWTSEALQSLLHSDWPGNVRELENLIRGAVAGRDTGEVTADDLPGHLRSGLQRHLGPLDKMERDAILAALNECHGKKSDAAQLLGISRSTIYRKIRAFGLDLDRTAF